MVLTSLIFPPHLSYICLIIPALLPEFFPGLLCLHTWTISLSLALPALQFFVFFFVFFLAYQLFPCAQSFSACTSSPQWYSLYLSPVLCSVIVKSLIMCPWSCHVCLFQLLILNKLYPLIFLGSLSLHSMFRECLIQHGIGWLCHSVEEHHYQQFVLSTYFNPFINPTKQKGAWLIIIN